MKLIEISTKKYPNTFTMVDDEDYEELNKYKWLAHKKPTNSTQYAIRCGTIRMHRIIMKTPDGLEVDHIDGNGLNNQKSNLRNVTNAKNQYNRGCRKDNKLGIKGVSWDGTRKKYRAAITNKVSSKPAIVIVDCDTLQQAVFAHQWMEFAMYGQHAFCYRNTI